MTQRISSHLSGLPLLWSASQPAHFFSSRSCYNAFSNLQLQSPLPRPTQHHWCFPARSRANAFCHSRLQPPHSRSAAPDWSMFAQRWQWDFDRTNPALLWFPHFFCNFSVKFPEAVSSLTFWRANRALATVLCTFCRQFLQIDPRTRGNRDPTSATTEATLPDKTQGFAPENVFTREFTRVRTVTLPNYLMMAGWHDDVVDMMPWQSSVTWKFAS